MLIHSRFLKEINPAKLPQFVIITIIKTISVIKFQLVNRQDITICKNIDEPGQLDLNHFVTNDKTRENSNSKQAGTFDANISHNKYF